MTGFVARWNENAARYPADPCLFLEDQWVIRDVPPNMEVGIDNTIRLLPHQREILTEFFRRKSNGDLAYNLMVYSSIKKSGKTEIEAGIAEWTALAFSGTPELYFIGNDKEQAQTRAFAAIGMQINPRSKAFNAAVASQFEIPNRFTPSLSILPLAGGGFLKSIPIDYAGEAGANPLATFFDELWGADRESQRRLWDEMTPPPTRRNAFRFVATYAGFKRESELLWDIYKRIVGDTPAERRKRRIHPTLPIFVSASGDEIAYWDEDVAARRMPWQTPDYYRSQKANNRPSMFDRIHRNLWVSAETNFILPDLWDRLERYTRAVPNNERYPVYLGVDSAHKRDTLNVTAIEYLPLVSASGRPLKRVVDSRFWRPTRERVVIPEETALPYIRSAIESWNVCGIAYDPNHFETCAALLRREYPRLDIREMSPSPAQLTRQGSGLYDDINYRCLIVYSEPDDPDTLRQHVLNAVAVETAVGWRLSKGLDKNKIDGAASLSEAILLANERGATDLEKSSPMYIFGSDEDEDAW